MHERLGLLSFSKLELLAQAGIIPKDLASVDPPMCQDCADGKVHRHQGQHEGMRNLKQIKTSTCPQQVVSVDQLISPTEEFVPIH